MAGVSYCDGETEKQPAAGPVRRLWQLCSIKWFINAARAERGTARQRRKRERKRERQPASITQLTLPWLCSRAHTSTRPLSPSLSPLSLSHTHTHSLSHTDTGTGTQGCRGSAVRSSTEHHSLSGMSLVSLNQSRSFCVLFSAVTDNPVNKPFQPRAPPQPPLMSSHD